MKQLAGTLLVIGGGTLSLVPAISVVRLGGVITSADIMLWILGGTSVLLGGLFTRIYNEQCLRLLVYKGIACYKAMAILTLNALVLYVGLEVAARSSFKIGSLTSSPAQELVGEGHSREKVSYYSSQDWAAQHWDEFRRSRTQQYYPYVGWRRAPFKGKTINIDENGVRLTPGADCRAGSFKVFTFGASEMWGTGSPDWATIPAHLQKSLEKVRQGPVCVMNFAESAYVSMQDVIMLLMQLRSGNVPDVVLFYDLGSDIFAAYQSGRAGVHHNLAQLAAKFERGQKPPTLVDLLRNTSSYALVNALIDKLSIANPQQEEPTPSNLVTYESMGIDAAKLSDSIVRNYFGNYEIVNGLAQQYGFKYFFFLPPRIIMGNKPLTSEEQEMKYEMESQVALYKLYTAVYQIIKKESSKYQNLYTIDHIFDRYDSLIWIDAAHATPFGNQWIAARMLKAIRAQSSDEK